MTIYRFSNNAATTLGSAISPTATTITVASSTGSRFPSPTAGQYFTATLFASGSSTGLPNEIVLVTARTGDSMTVVRGQEGTTAQSWNVGDSFDNFVTAGFLNQLVDSGSLQAQSGNYAVDSGTANAGVITLSPVPASLTALIGMPIRVKKGGAASTGAYTLNVNTLGAKAVLVGGVALEGGELVASEIFEVVYDGTQFNLISNPGTVHGDRLTANSVLNAALAQMGANTLKGNLTGAAATPYDVPLASVVGANFVSGTTGGINWRTWPDSSGKTAIHMSGTLTYYSESSQTASYPFTLSSVTDYGASTVIPFSGPYYDQGAKVVGTPGLTLTTINMQQYGGGDRTWPISARWWVEGFLA